MKRLRTLAFSVVILPLSLQAQTKYVDDTLYLGFYKEPDGSGSQFSSVPSGTKLTFIESKNSYSLVRTEKGTEGWVKSKYLVDKPPAVVRIKALEKVATRADALAGEVESLNEENTLLRTEIDSLKVKLKKAGDNPQPAASTADEQAGEKETLNGQQLLALNSAMTEAAHSLQKVTEAARNLGVAENDAQAAGDIDVNVSVLSSENNSGFTGFLEEDGSSLLGWESILAELRATKPLHYILIVIAALSGFGLGLFVLDRRIRKQHGGYRIW